MMQAYLLKFCQFMCLGHATIYRLPGGCHGLKVAAADRIKNKRQIGFERFECCFRRIAILALDIKCDGIMLGAVASDDVR